MVIRAKHIVTAISILTLASFIIGYIKKPFEWSQTTQEVEKLKPVIWNTKSRVDVIEARQQDMLTLLRDIKHEVTH